MVIVARCAYLSVCVCTATTSVIRLLMVLSFTFGIEHVPSEWIYKMNVKIMLINENITLVYVRSNTYSDRVE